MKKILLLLLIFVVGVQAQKVQSFDEFYLDGLKIKPKSYTWTLSMPTYSINDTIVFKRINGQTVFSNDGVTFNAIPDSFGTAIGWTKTPGGSMYNATVTDTLYLRASAGDTTGTAKNNFYGTSRFYGATTLPASTTLTTPILGVATGTSLALTGNLFAGYGSDPTSGNRAAFNGNIYVNGTGTFTGTLTNTATQSGLAGIMNVVSTNGQSSLDLKVNSSANMSARMRTDGATLNLVSVGGFIFYRNGESGTGANAMEIASSTGAVTFSGNLITRDSLITRNEVSSLADSLGVITLATGVSGWGEVMAGDNQEWASFRFTSAGVVTLIANSANVTTTLNEVDKLNIYDAGSGIAIQNNLGAQKKVAIKINYYVP